MKLLILLISIISVAMITEFVIKLLKSNFFIKKVKDVEHATFSISLEPDEKERLIVILSLKILCLISLITSIIIISIGFLFLLSRISNLDPKNFLFLASIASLAYLMVRYVVFGKSLDENSPLTQSTMSRYNFFYLS